MRTFCQICIVLVLTAFPVIHAQSQSAAAPAEAQITSLIREFLSHVNDPAMHDRFWADDLIYTGASGKTRTKAQIMKDLREEAGKPQQDTSTFSAEDIVVHQYGDVAVASLHLVHKDAGKTEDFRNTGTFLNRNGQWRAVAWQATKVQP
jgi:ketosteroid isomerase-like protein